MEFSSMTFFCFGKNLNQQMEWFGCSTEESVYLFWWLSAGDPPKNERTAGTWDFHLIWKGTSIWTKPPWLWGSILVFGGYIVFFVPSKICSQDPNFAKNVRVGLGWAMKKTHSCLGFVKQPWLMSTFRRFGEVLVLQGFSGSWISSPWLSRKELLLSTVVGGE